jgi:hypothetical protein
VYRVRGDVSGRAYHVRGLTPWCLATFAAQGRGGRKPAPYNRNKPKPGKAKEDDELDPMDPASYAGVWGLCLGFGFGFLLIVCLGLDSGFCIDYFRILDLDSGFCIDCLKIASSLGFCR